MIQTVPDDKRAAQIAAIHDLAHWLAANPDVPMPNLTMQRHHLGGTEAENLAAVRKLADTLGVEIDENLDDRTVLRYKIGGHVWYELFAWHKGGRGSAAELERLRAENAALRRQTGLAYSREHAAADDPRPVSPARGGQPHVVAVTDEGLVDETPADAGDPGHCDRCGDPMAWTGNVPQTWTERAGNRRIHAWPGRLGLSERPYSHEAATPVSESR